MKRKKPSRIKRLFNRVLNIAQWSDWVRLKDGVASICGMASTFVQIPKTKKDKNFDAACKKLHLTDADLAQREKALFRMSVMMLIVAVVLFLYFLYHLVWGTYSGAILSVGVCSVATGLAFRYHFWFFQIKSRKLGCTWDEWLQQGLLKRCETVKNK